MVLTNGDPDAYALEDAIEVTRSVRVMGNPAVLPTIDGSEAVRCFTVGVGGFLELSFVRTKQGGGVTRPRYFLEDLLPDTATVTEIRGGAVAVEPGAIGANFDGVVFTGRGQRHRVGAERHRVHAQLRGRPHLRRARLRGWRHRQLPWLQLLVRGDGRQLTE